MLDDARSSGKLTTTKVTPLGSCQCGCGCSCACLCLCPFWINKAGSYTSNLNSAASSTAQSKWYKNARNYSGP